MADPNPQEIAADVMLDRVRAVEDREIHRRLEEFDLTADESDALVELVRELIHTADLTIEFRTAEEASR